MTPIVLTAHLIGRIAAGAAMGGIIGYERDLHGRPIGLRTHLLVAMAASTFMVVSSQFAYFQEYTPGGVVEVDGSRIAASVVSAIGFLAAGAILRTGGTIQGLTTAAGLWLVTAIGLAAGAGMFAVSLAVTFMGLVALTIMRRFEDKNDHVIRRRVMVIADGKTSASDVTSAVKALGATVHAIEYDRRLDVKAKRTIKFEAVMPLEVELEHLVEALEAIPGIRRVQIS